MNTVPVIAIFDIGKTNKKLFLFDETYRNVYEKTVQLQETEDEDGDACEDLATLTEWVKDSFKDVFQLPQFEIKAINFSAYGASLVHIMKQGKSLLPLYNYLKPFPKYLLKDFFDTYGEETEIAMETASPVSGNLNSGLQLYRFKKQSPEAFENIHTSLHLPQYISYLISDQKFSDITSIGCHTLLWDFNNMKYHPWVYNEEINKMLAPLKESDEIIEVTYNQKNLITGIGLHDSSAALIPYLINFKEPFILISTGTWCISLNPFNNSALTYEELKNDCLCYLQYQALPVKANRLFAGYEHEQQVQKLADHFLRPIDFYKQVSFNASLIKDQHDNFPSAKTVNGFASFNPASFSNYEEAYHQLMRNIIEKQVTSTKLVLKDTEVKRIFVDGGFSKNSIYMNLLAASFPAIEVFAASMPQSTAMGAALAIHHKWNNNVLPGDLIELKLYTVPKE